MLRKLITAVVSTSLVASSAQAARLIDVEGTVLVNTGEGFWEARGKTLVSVGDRILVRGKGRAQIDYGAGCVTKISANQTVVVASRPTCNVAAPKNSSAPKSYASLKSSPVPRPFNEGLEEQRILIVGGLVVVSSAAAALAAGNDDNKERPPVVKNAPPIVGTEATASLAAEVGRSDDGSRLLGARSAVVAPDGAAALAFNGGAHEDGTPVSP